jgi:hypothetical protein
VAEDDDYAASGWSEAAALGAELLADGFVPSTMDRLESQIIRIFLFMEADGRDWVHAGPYDVMVYPGDLYLSGTVGGSPVAGYPSAINSFYKQIGMPASGLISPRALHPILKGGLTRIHAAQGRECGDERRARRSLRGYRMHACAAGALATTTRGDQSVARAYVVQVVQYYLFDRPTSNLCILRGMCSSEAGI